MKSLSMILAVEDQYGIGMNNGLPWGHISEDMKWFKEQTRDAVVIMGSSTWDSLPKKPLPSRVNVVLSSRDDITGADMVLEGIPELIAAKLEALYPDKRKVIMGGAKVYQAFLPLVSKVYLTRIHQTCEADTFLNIDEMLAEGEFKKVSQHSEQDGAIVFEVWEKA